MFSNGSDISSSFLEFTIVGEFKKIMYIIIYCLNFCLTVSFVFLHRFACTEVLCNIYSVNIAL